MNAVAGFSGLNVMDITPETPPSKALETRIERMSTVERARNHALATFVSDILLAELETGAERVVLDRVALRRVTGISHLIALMPPSESSVTLADLDSFQEDGRLLSVLTRNRLLAAVLLLKSALEEIDAEKEMELGGGIDRYSRVLYNAVN